MLKYSYKLIVMCLCATLIVSCAVNDNGKNKDKVKPSNITEKTVYVTDIVAVSPTDFAFKKSTGEIVQNDNLINFLQSRLNVDCKVSDIEPWDSFRAVELTPLECNGKAVNKIILNKTDLSASYNDSMYYDLFYPFAMILYKDGTTSVHAQGIWTLDGAPTLCAFYSFNRERSSLTPSVTATVKDGSKACISGTEFKLDALKHVEQVVYNDKSFAALLGSGKVLTWGDAWESSGDSREVQKKLEKNICSVHAMRWGMIALQKKELNKSCGMQKSFIPIGWSANTQFTDFLQTIQGDVLKVSTNKQAMAVLQQDGKLKLLGEKAFGGEFCAYNNAKRKCSVINYPSFNKQEKVLDKVMNVFSLKNGFVAVVRGEGLVRWGKQTAAGINSIELKSIDLPATPTSSTVAVKTIEDAIAVRDIGDNETIFWGDSMIYKTSHQSLNLNNVNTSSRFAFYSKGNYGDLYCHVTSDGVFMETYNITVDGTLKRSAATVRNSGSYLCADDVKRLATIPSGALLLKNSGKMQLLLFSRQN